MDRSLPIALAAAFCTLCATVTTSSRAPFRSALPRDAHASITAPWKVGERAGGLPPPSPSPSPSPSYTSFLEHVPNEIASNVFWSLRNVSYKDGIVFFHSPAPIDKEIMTSKYYHTKGDLPWSGEDSSMPPRIKQIVFTDETFDESKCATVETRSIVFARVNHKSNCFACNQGHLIINMINPLFLYLFYIREVSERERRRRRCIFAMKCAKLNLLRYSQI